MPSITNLHGRLVRDSRGSKTVEVEVTADGRFTGRASAPSGASVGIHEAAGFPGSPEACLEVLKKNASRFVGADPSSLKGVHDALREIDPTPKYEVCGGGVAFAVTLASADAAAKASGEPLFRVLSGEEPQLPRPLGNVLGGGAHAGPGTPDIQEVLVCATGAKTAAEAVEANAQVHAQLGRTLLKDPSFTGGRGDEGGWAPRMRSEDAVEAAARAIEKLGYTLGEEVSLGIDFAASTMWKSGAYEYLRDGASRSPGEQEDFVAGLAEKFKLIYAEDPVHEEDFEGAARLTKRLPRTMVAGDDLTVTSASILERAAASGSCSGAILKVNQAGSLHEAMEFASAARRLGIGTVTSHRSGETCDPHIVHVGVAAGSAMLKSGIVGGERVAKSNELLRLSEHDLIHSLRAVPR